LKAVAIIPARYGSSRFYGKPLALLAGKPLIQHVYQRAHRSELFTEILVATDDERIYDTVTSFGGNVCMTGKHESGSDRIAGVCRNLNCDVVVNVQGDEPFITAEVLRKLVDAMHDNTIQVATLAHEVESDENNPNWVKVVCDASGNALYFSRAPIPYYRDGISGYLKHIGVYAYRKQTLLQFVQMKPSRLEKIENLEQLRLLENGISIRIVKTEYNGFGIDTPEDLKQAEELLRTSSKQ